MKLTTPQIRCLVNTYCYFAHCESVSTARALYRRGLLLRETRWSPLSERGVLWVQAYLAGRADQSSGRPVVERRVGA